MTRLLLAATMAAAAAAVAAAQSASQMTELNPAFTGTTSVSCTFTLRTISRWNGDQPAAETKPATLTLKFVDLDIDEGTGRVAVTNGTGSGQLIVKAENGNLHFVQLFLAGALHVTTIFTNEIKDGKAKAVHSRHEFTPVELPGFTSRPEQWVGSCEPGGRSSS
jgi:hypothetical protein